MTSMLELTAPLQWWPTKKKRTFTFHFHATPGSVGIIGVIHQIS
jgi:hypothetical protein